MKLVIVVQNALCWEVITHRASTSPRLSIQPAGGQSYCFQNTFCSFKWTRTIVSGISETWKWPKEIYALLCEVVPSASVRASSLVRSCHPQQRISRQKTSRVQRWVPYRHTLHILPRVFVAACLFRWKSDVQHTWYLPTIPSTLENIIQEFRESEQSK